MEERKHLTSRLRQRHLRAVSELKRSAKKIKPFTSSKVAIPCDDKLVVILRDYKLESPFPNMWEFPGGRRELNETPEQCAFREVYEELGLEIEKLLWKKEYPSDDHTEMVSYFFVVSITPERLKDIRFGNEGKGWALMSVNEYMKHDRAIPKMKNKLPDFLEKTTEQDKTVDTTAASAA